MTQVQTQASELIPIETMGQLAQAVAHWHAQRVAVLQQLAQVPVGAEFQIGDGEHATKIVLDDSTRAAFVLGVELSLMQVSELPFAMEMEPDTDEPAKTA